MEAAEVAEKLGAVQRVAAAFVACLGVYRARSIRTYPGNPWRFSSAAVFGHLDVFRQRLSDLADIAATALQFGRLERIDIGGSLVRTQIRAGHSPGGCTGNNALSKLCLHAGCKR